MRAFLRALVVVVLVTLAGAALPSMADSSSSSAPSSSNGSTEATQPPPAASRSAASVAATTAAKPLAGLTIALDPGHQLGNHNFPRQINRPVPAGGFTKPCNTTGAATNSGIAEATVNMRLARAVKRRLVALGAKVPMTRTTNSQERWGPCVDKRGEFGKRVGARLTVSLHADGAPSSAHGFHVIAPTSRRPWTSDIAKPSLRLAKALRDGLTAYRIPRSTYIGHGTGLDVRSDLGTLNMSDVPVAMIEIGNMRNATDAYRMTHPKGRGQYADAVVRGIRSYLRR